MHVFEKREKFISSYWSGTVMNNITVSVFTLECCQNGSSSHTHFLPDLSIYSPSWLVKKQFLLILISKAFYT